MELQLAREILSQENCTCVLVRGESVLKSHDRGVKPLMQWMEQGLDLTGYCAADKVVGKATAYLYAQLGIHGVYAPVMSRGAVQVLQRYGIEYTCDELVEAIFNRARDGFCPMESAVWSVDDRETAMQIILEKYKQMIRK